MAVANLPPLGKLPSEKNEPVETKKKLEKVTKGEVKVKEKSLANKFADAFITDDIGSVRKHVVEEVIVPGLINAVLDAVNDGLSMIFKVSPRRRSGSSGSGGYYDYSKQSSYKYGGGGSSSNSTSRTESASKERIDYRGITFETKNDANDVLSSMQDLADPDQYGWASVADFYDLAGVSVKNQAFTDNKYGWNLPMLRGVSIRRDREGWYLDLPKPVVID